MSAIQPGDGYVLKASSSGKTLDIENVWPHEHGPETGASLVIELFQPHPFRITKLTSETALGGGFFYNLYPDSGSTYIVVPGTVNGTLCSLGVTSCGTATSFVYVQTYPDPSIGIVVSSSPLYNSNSAAYVLIGTVDQYGKNQFVKSNLLRERFRLGQAAADYHHSYTDIL